VGFWLTIYNTPLVFHLSATGQNSWILAAHQNQPFCAAALANKARTSLHYPLPLAIDDVGIAGCTTMCSLTDPHSLFYQGRTGA